MKFCFEKKDFIETNIAPNKLAVIGDDFELTWIQFSERVNDLWNEFIKKEYPGVSILTSVCGGVPCSMPMKEPIANGLMLAGDAAHHVNPMTGGGIISGMKAGMLAGKVGSESIKDKNYSKNYLKKYPKKMFKDFVLENLSLIFFSVKNK